MEKRVSIEVYDRIKTKFVGKSNSIIALKTIGRDRETFFKEQTENNRISVMEKIENMSKQKPSFKNQYLAALVGKYLTRKHDKTN